MQRISVLRNKLYAAIESGKTQEILQISRELDMEILKYMHDEKANSKTKKLRFLEKKERQMRLHNGEGSKQIW